MTGSGDEALILDGVEKTYGRHRALARVSTTFAPGRIAVVLGPNGAGKSTLLGILATLIPPTAGRVSWAGAPMAMGSPLRGEIGYVGHDPGLYPDLSARQNLLFFAALFGLPDAGAAVTRLLERVGLAAELEQRADVPVRTFSRGMQQRLALARALLHDPALLLFDEPSAALDPAGAAWLAHQLTAERRAGRIVIVVTHDLEAAAAIAEHVVILRRGRIVHDESPSVPLSGDELRTLYKEKTGGAA